MNADGDVLLPYRIRAVRVAVISTWLALGVLVLFPLLPHHQKIDQPLYPITVGIAAAAALVASRLPWDRLFREGRGAWLMVAWSTADILLITLALAATGGARSELFWLYGLTTLFLIVAAYPVRDQVLLMAFTVGCYLVVSAMTGWTLSPALVFVRLALLGTLAVMGVLLARELTRMAQAERRSGGEADRRANLLATVAGAARSMSTLDPERILDAVVDSVRALGFEAANICLFDESGETYRVTHPRGIPEEYVAGVHRATAGMPGMVRRNESTVVVEDYASRSEGIPILRQAGFQAVIASPIWLERTMAAVLVAGTRQHRSLPVEEVEAFELLAGQAGSALANARRYEEERSSVERLAELDRLKRDFLSNVSHELRTPLTVIGGMGQTLEERWDSFDDAARRELLSKVNANAAALDGVIASLLDFSAVESGKLEARPESVDLSRLLGALVIRLSSLFEDGALTVQIEDGLVVHADPLLIDRAVENLLSNAAKHTDPGTAVELVARAEGSYARVVVTDDGRGMDEEELDHLGERFFRGGMTDTRRTKGLGLGIAFVQTILDLHGSRLEIRSELGTGSRFTFALPLVGVPGRDARREAPQTAG